MSVLTGEQLQAVMPRCEVSVWLNPLTAAMGAWGINTHRRAAMFLAQVAHESGECRHLIENLNYSAEALLRTWPSRFDPAMAHHYARQPEAIANIAYAGRMGNGDRASGDGWRYRGRGLIQVTGRGNYREAGDVLKLPLLDQPDLLLEPRYAAASAAWFFVVRGNCIPAADLGDIDAVTYRINGGRNGIDDRRVYYRKACKVLGV
jgi:putative chitinase